jgi:hypothetical protein
VRKEVERVAVFLGALAFVNGILSLEVGSIVVYLFYILGIVFAFLYLVKDDRRFADLIVFLRLLLHLQLSRYTDSHHKQMRKA